LPDKTAHASSDDPRRDHGPAEILRRATVTVAIRGAGADR